MPDTRYKKGVVEEYTNLMADHHGGSPGDYIEACRKFVDEHKDWHEQNRHNFTPKEGFLEQI